MPRSSSPLASVGRFATIFTGFLTSSLFAADALTPGKPMQLEGTHGKFDFISVDAERHRLLAAHTGNGTLDVIDLDEKKLVKAVATGAAQSAAVDGAGRQYVVAVSKPPQMVVVDAGKLEVVGKVPLTGPADILAVDPRTGNAYVDHDDASELWVVSPSEMKVKAAVALPGDSPEDLGIDAGGTRLFQCMKNGSVVAVVDLAAGKVVEKWPTAPAEAPHGMAFLPEQNAFIVAGGNGKLVMMSGKDGKVLASADIPARVDEIALDRELRQVYCASGTGKLAVLKIGDGKLMPAGEVASAAGCHSVAVDAKTHTVWVAFAQGDKSFVQAFTPAN